MDSRLVPCRGALHSTPPAPGAVHLEWGPVATAADHEVTPLPMRLVAFTCDRCRPVSYEYGVVGGAYRIRRTDHDRRQVRETPAVPRSQAEEWWRALLTGWAI